MSSKKIATTWSRPPATGQPPRPRCSHASCVTDHRLVVCGGWSSGSRFLNDLYIYSIDTNSWSMPQTKGQLKTRVGHSMTIGSTPDEIWVIGGQLGIDIFLDAQVLNLKTLEWSSPTLGGTEMPQPRSRHSATKFGTHIYIFGGGNNLSLFNDLWSIDLTSMTWNCLVTNGKSPSARWGHTATLVDSRLFIFGGHDGESRLNDVHVLDLSTLHWSTPVCRPKGNSSGVSPRSINLSSSSDDLLPSPTSSIRSSSSEIPEIPELPEVSQDSSSLSPASSSNSSLDLSSSNQQKQLEDPQLIISNNSSSSSSNHNISINIGNQPQTIPSSSPSSSSLSPRSAQISQKSAQIGSPKYSRGPTRSETAAQIAALEFQGLPPARAGHTACSIGRKLIIYGGGDGKLLGDMYNLNVDTFEWSSMESGNVPDRCAHTCDVFLSPLGPRLLVFGGSNGIKTFNDLYIVTCGKNKLRLGKRRLSNSSSSMTKPVDSSPSSSSAINSSPPSSAINSSPPSSPVPYSTTSSSQISSTASPSIHSDNATHPVPVQASTAQTTSNKSNSQLTYKDALKLTNSSNIYNNSSNSNTQNQQPQHFPKSSLNPPNNNHPLNSNNYQVLQRLLNEVGLSRCWNLFVEQEISLDQIESLHESHFSSLGIQTIRDQVLMSKLKENVRSYLLKNPASNTANAAAATPTIMGPPSSSSSSPSSTSELIKQVQLSTNALASAADSLRAAAAVSTSNNIPNHADHAKIPTS